jgi:acyl dehydratase
VRTIEAGDRIPAWSLPMTPTTIVSTAIATRDWQDVHHDRDIAQAAGSKDIFMNILTTNGLVEKFVADWVGHDAEIKGIAIRLGAPAHPYDTLTFTGTVSSVEDGLATIDVVGAVSLGDHVTGTVRLDTLAGARYSTTESPGV